MQLPLSEAVVPRLDWMPVADSTNDVLVQAAKTGDPADWPDLSVVATDNQVAGRGRLGRTWTAPAGRSLAISVLLRPRLDSGEPLSFDRYSILPLVVGLAMTRAVAGVVPAASDPVSLKWPNDVLIGPKKVSGILGELLPDGTGVVIGAGLNLALTDDELPTPTSTSLALAGVKDVSADAVLAAYLSALTTLYRRQLSAGGDSVAAGVHAEIVAACGTLGRAVRVELPGGGIETGIARTIDQSGRLVVDPSRGGDPLFVAAGDVTHLRHDDTGS
jgi:BirA family biotin operon repressor/biotin-[acetyl-CoA-carboxylase] ligase